MVDGICWLLHGLVRYYKPDVIIQTGHLWGKSALVMLDAMAGGQLETDQSSDPAFSEYVREHDPGHRSSPILHSIDPEPKSVPNWNAGVKFLSDLYPTSFCYHPITSKAFFENLVTESDSHDRIMGVVDGDHSVSGCKADIASLASLGAELIVIDDTGWIAALAGVSMEAAERYGYRMMDFPLYNGVMVLMK